MQYFIHPTDISNRRYPGVSKKVAKHSTMDKGDLYLVGRSRVAGGVNLSSVVQ